MAPGFVNYLIRQPTRQNPSVLVDIKVTLMSLAHAAFWEKRIQPHISHQAGRADRYWSWVLFRTVLVSAQRLRGRNSIGLVTMIKGPHGPIPAAMSLLVDPYDYFGGPRHASMKSTFVWLLATAPDEALQALGVSNAPSLGVACVDNALVYSVNNFYDGRVGLKAARAGGDRLLKFYEERVGLLPVGPRFSRLSASPSRLFYSDSATAAAIIKANSVDGYGRALRT